MELKSIGAVSAGKILGILYALMGLIGGLLSLPFVAWMASLAQRRSGGFSLLLVFGIGAIFISPILSGVLGFITGAIGAALYNLVARLVGGLEISFEERRA